MTLVVQLRCKGSDLTQLGASSAVVTNRTTSAKSCLIVNVLAVILQHELCNTEICGHHEVTLVTRGNEHVTARSSKLEYLNLGGGNVMVSFLKDHQQPSQTSLQFKVYYYIINLYSTRAPSVVRPFKFP